MRVGRLLLFVTVVALVAAPLARAEDPPLVNWPALLPALAPGFTPNTFDICRDGSPSCLDHTLRELRARIAAHDEQCSDNALFARNYRLVTDFYQRLAGTGFFQDDGYVAREDAIFASLYFAAEDAWREGRKEDVPEAWRIAFQAADDKAVQGAGNLLLGINAHVQRDQPFMIAGLGLVDENGRSRKADHDKFNELLNTAYDDVFAQAIAWDDPDLAFYDPQQTTADNLLAFQTIAGWREGVWRNAERLVRAKSDEERRLVAESIERNAAAWAEMIRASFPYGGPFTRERRDALCAKRAEAAAAERAALAEEPRDPEQPPAKKRKPPPIAMCEAWGLSSRAKGRRIVVHSICGSIDWVTITRRAAGGRCRFVTKRGRLSAPRPCTKRIWLRVPVRTKPLPAGRYVTSGGGLRLRTRIR